MTAIATERRRYDKPAQLSVESAARELNALTKASLVLVRRLRAKGASAEAGATIEQALKAAERNLDLMRRLLAPAPATAPAAASNGATIDSLVRDGLLVESAQACERSGCSRQALSKAVAARRIFFIEDAGRRLFPAFFFDGRYQRVDMEAVSKALGNLPGGAKLQFFLSQRGSLGGKSVLEAMARGDKDSVIAAARAFAEG
jgi:hypothetical protein